MKREHRPLPALDFVILTLALLGFTINLYLLVRRFADGSAGVAGCGGGSCDEVLASRWSAVFGIPVTVLGVLVYAGLILSLTDRFRRWNLPLLGAVTGAALWFVFVQGVILEKICPWCMSAHAVGIAVMGFGLLRHGGSREFVSMLWCVAKWTAAAFLGIGLAQVYGPIPATYRIEGAVSSAAVPAPEAGEGRKVLFNGGLKSYDVMSLPRRGPADAKHVMVEFFDYQCAACRTMAGILEAFAAKHPKDVAILLMPAPLDEACNEHVPAGGQHPGSCEIARIAIAVWRVKPEAFATWHQKIIAGPSVASAYRLALETMSHDRLESALADSSIDRQIRANLADLREFSKTTDKLPKLLIRDTRILHGLPSGEADFIRVMEKELGL